MGVTMESKNLSADMGCGGFNKFRNKVAQLSHVEFGKHYSKLEDAMFLSGIERDQYFKKYDEKTKELIKENIVTVEIANFCYQSDCEGSINKDQAIQIYEKIKDYDDNICYGYAGRFDCAMFSDLKDIFKDCVENGGTIEWS